MTQHRRSFIKQLYRAILDLKLPTEIRQAALLELQSGHLIATEQLLRPYVRFIT